MSSISPAVHAGEALAEGAGLAIGPVDRGVERDFGRRHLLGRADRVGGFLEEAR